nr:MAG TPA: Scaffolding protein SbcC like [Caudoviricetes sp.]
MAYENLMLRPACPGNLSDTSNYNIDGSCVAQGDIEFGSAVKVIGIVGGVKVVSTLTDGETPYGIAFRSQYEHLSGKILDGEVCNVVSHGRMWTLTSLDEAPALFSKLQFGSGGVVTGSSGSVGWTFAGGFVKHEDGYIIEVQVKQNAFIVPPPPPPVVLVESATITTNKESPQPNNAPVQFNVAVKPDNATDKTGVWSVDAENIATIDPKSGVLTPIGGDAAGSVIVNWTANDASKTKESITYVFDAVPAEEEES